MKQYNIKLGFLMAVLVSLTITILHKYTIVPTLKPPINEPVYMIYGFLFFFYTTSGIFMKDMLIELRKYQKRDVYSEFDIDIIAMPASILLWLSIGIGVYGTFGAILAILAICSIVLTIGLMQKCLKELFAVIYIILTALLLFTLCILTFLKLAESLYMDFTIYYIISFSLILLNYFIVCTKKGKIFFALA